MPIVRIDAREISDFATFHTVFARTFAFPDFYGRNMDAWIDCMSNLDDSETGMTKVHGTPSDPVVLQIANIDDLPHSVYQALVDTCLRGR
jgi:hypothetical protein